jgi:hypothetical protein
MTQTKRPLVDAAAVLSALVTLSTGLALVVIRGEVDNSVTVLVLAAVVSLCGALGGWRAGIWAAVSAAVAFNFFHTQPYLSLRIHDADDVLTTACLVVVGLIAGVTSSVVHRGQTRIEEAGTELAAIERIADLVATGRAPADVETSVRAELLEVLRLSGCRFERKTGKRPHLGRRGEVDEAIRKFHDGGFELPANGVAIPVLSRGDLVGYLVCEPTPGAVVSVARRRAAVAIADLLGAAIAVDPTHSRS